MGTCEPSQIEESLEQHRDKISQDKRHHPVSPNAQEIELWCILRLAKEGLPTPSASLHCVPQPFPRPVHEQCIAH